MRTDKPVMRKNGKQWFCGRRNSFIFGFGRTREAAYAMWQGLNRDETTEQESQRLIWGPLNG